MVCGRGRRLTEEIPAKHDIDRRRIERAVREILIAIGDDPDREGVLGTPERVADAYAYLFAGLGEDPTRHLEVGFAEDRSEEHTSELQSRQYLVCRLLLEKKN